MDHAENAKRWALYIIQIPFLLISDALLICGILIMPLLAIWLFEIEASATIFAVIFGVGAALAILAYKMPDVFGFSSDEKGREIEPSPEPLTRVRAATRIVIVTGICLYALLPAAGSTGTTPKIARPKPVDYRHHLDNDAILRKISSIRSDWPSIMERSTSHDLGLVSGIVAAVLMSGYKCDTVSDIITRSDRIKVWCNNSRFAYAVTSANGLPIARPLR